MRTLLLATTFICILLGGIVVPIGTEVFRAAEVARQTSELEAQGYYIRHAKRSDSFSLWLTRNLWSHRMEYLGRDIAMLGSGHQVSRDIAKIPAIPSVDELRFRYARATCSDDSFLQPDIRSVTYHEGDERDPPLEPDIHLLLHHPHVEKVRIWRVPADTRVLGDLALCAHLRRLELSLLDRYVHDGERSRRLPLDTDPLRNLKQIEELQIIGLPEVVDWSFVGDMQALREASIKPTGSYVTGGINIERTPLPTREATPPYHLARLGRLRKPELESTPAFAEDLAILAQHAPLEHLKLEHVPEGPSALAGLRQASSLAPCI